jgi:hydroxymethylglutaryl-CoA reductase
VGQGRCPPRHARLKDLSFTGLSLLYPVAVPVGSILRVKSPQFEALVQVVACRAQAGQFSLHGQLLTLALDRTGRGVYVDAKA